MIKCPNAECGAENVDGTQFCEACGEELPQGGASSGAAASGATATSGVTGSAPALVSTPDMVKCPACDNMNPADNLICEVCGSELKPAGSTPPADTSAASVTATTTTDTATLGATTPAAAPALPIDTAPSVDPLATGTSVPPLGATLPDVSAIPTVGVSTTSASTAAPDALPDMAPDVSASTSDLPVVATGDTTNSFAPTATATGVPDVGVSAVGATIADPNATAIPTDPAVGADPTTSTPVAAAPSGNLQPGAVKFTVEQGMTIGKQFVLGDNEILVGREDDEEGIYPDIDLSDQDEGFVHRKHAQLNFKDGVLTVTHLGGANKTRVNNKPLDDNTPQPVNIGDKVSFGKVVMRVGSV